MTLNEEKNLKACLQSLAWCDDVVVFDSFSSDQTEQMAADGGARFFQRKFDDYASQRNAALSDVQYKHPWVFMLDADERFTPELAADIMQKLSDIDDGVSLIRLRRKDIFMDRWIKHSSGYPTWFGRLMRVSKVRFERKVHEDCHTEDEVGFIKEHMLHYPFSKGLGNWFDKHNEYSSVEAGIRLAEREKTVSLRSLFSRDSNERRRALKREAYRLPLRPFLVFVYLYFGRMGFTECKPGFLYCCFRAVYEYMIDLKV